MASDASGGRRHYGRQPDVGAVGHSAVEDAELFLYPGDQHSFADSSLPSYDPDATALLIERVLALLARR